MKPLRATPRLVLIGMIFLAVMAMGARLTDMFAILSGERDVPVITPSQAENKATTESDKAPADAPAATPTPPEAKAEEPKAEPAKPEEATPEAAGHEEGKAGDGHATEEKHADQKPPNVSVPAVTPAESGKKDDKPAETKAETVPAPSGPSFIGDVSEAEREVLKQLSARREKLETREREIEQKGALLLATEQRVDQKLKEMEKLRTDLNKLLNTVNEQRAGELGNLVRIYSAMKPAEAARILATLDTPVILGVIRQMKPAVSAPILAGMPPERAKEITTELTRAYDLPGAAP